MRPATHSCVDVEIHIAAPPERVWQLLAEHERMPEWMPVREVVLRRPGQPNSNGVGAIRTIRGGGLVVDESIVVFESGQRLEYVLLEGAPVRDHRGVVCVDPEAGGTRVRWKVRFRPLVPGTRRPLAWALRRALRQGLTGLRQLAETGDPPRRRGKMRRRRPSSTCERESIRIVADPKLVPDISTLKSLAGQHLGSSDWVRVTQEQIDAFAQATGDHQWIHVDVERAQRESPFKQTIAHGYLTLALAPALLPQIIRVEGVRMGVNYGLDKMRLPAPVPAGSRVRLLADLKEVRDMPGGGARATYGLTFELEGGGKPACVADAIYVYYA